MQPGRILESRAAQLSLDWDIFSHQRTKRWNIGKCPNILILIVFPSNTLGIGKVRGKVEFVHLP